MTLTLREGDADAFFGAPFEIYGREVGYVSPMKADIRRMLDASRNPLWTSGNPFRFWTAHRDGRMTGRIIAHLHRQSDEIHGTNKALFGFFDCARDDESATALLDAACDFALSHGRSALVGNFNLTAMQQIGIQTGGFGREAYTDMITGPGYLPDLLERNGFRRTFPMTTFEIELADVRVPPAAGKDASHGFTFAPVERGTFPERMDEARRILNAGFAGNPMFVPLTEEEFLFQADGMTTILDPRLSSIMLHEGDPIGAVICIPDVNRLLTATRSRIGLLTPFHYLRHRLSRKRAVLVFYSVRPEWHGQGVMPAMLARTIHALRDAGYERVGGTWISDENHASLRQIEKVGAKPLHRLHLFRKDLA